VLAVFAGAAALARISAYDFHGRAPPWKVEGRERHLVTATPKTWVSARVSSREAGDPIKNLLTP